MITASGSLDDAGYDKVITVSDGNGNTDVGKLTVTVTGERAFVKRSPVLVLNSQFLSYVHGSGILL